MTQIYLHFIQLQTHIENIYRQLNTGYIHTLNIYTVYRQLHTDVCASLLAIHAIKKTFDTNLFTFHSITNTH